MSSWSMDDGSALTGTFTFTNGSAIVQGNSSADTDEIKVGDIVKGGKFKNKSIKVKKIGKNDKGDITINDKPILRVRIPNENN